MISDSKKENRVVQVRPDDLNQFFEGFLLVGLILLFPASIYLALRKRRYRGLR
jgi:hypothetical protein